MTDFDPVFVQRVLDVFQFDNTDDLWWARDGESAKSGQTRFYVKCNDTFAYACADLEEVTPDNIDLLEQSFADAKEAAPRLGGCYASTLFVARVRKQKPLDAWIEICLKDETAALRPLFDAVEKAR